MKKIDELFKELNIHANQKGCHSGETWFGTGIEITSHSPVDGSLLGVVQAAGVEDYENAIIYRDKQIEIDIKLIQLKP